MPPTPQIAEAVARLTVDEAKILACFATPGQGYADVAKETGTSKDEVIRVVEKIASNNRAYAKTLALEWQRLNSPGRIGTATPPPTPVAAAGAPADPEPVADTIADLITRATDTEVPRLVRLADKAQDLIDQLEQQLTEYEEQAKLRTEAAELEQRLAAIKQQLGPSRPVAAASTSRADSRAIREWAKASGIDCPTHGRLPGTLIAAYEKRAVAS